MSSVRQVASHYSQWGMMMTIAMTESMVRSCLASGGIVFEPGTNEYEQGYQQGIADAIVSAMTEDVMLLEDPDEQDENASWFECGRLDGWNAAIAAIEPHRGSALGMMNLPWFDGE